MLCDRCGAMVTAEGDRLVLSGQACFACGAQFDAGPRACPECGADLGVECENCGMINDPTTRRCVSCGHDQFGGGMGHPELPPPIDARRKIVDFRLIWRRLPLLIGVIISAMALVNALPDPGQLDGQTRKILNIFFGLCAVAVIYLLFAPDRSNRTEIPGRPKRFRVAGRVEIFRSLDYNKAEHLLAILEQENLDVIIHNRNLVSLEPLASSGGVKIMVSEEDWDRARDVMTAYNFTAPDYADQD
ncbi:zinc ribbon domain-containing protein [bacterium]|nr:zinc ribbon domain-containing protein [bacterium]